jgi:hypothetical protein
MTRVNAAATRPANLLIVFLLNAVSSRFDPQSTADLDSEVSSPVSGRSCEPTTLMIERPGDASVNEM